MESTTLIGSIAYNCNLMSLYYHKEYEVYFIGCEPDIYSAVDYSSDLLLLLLNMGINPCDYPNFVSYIS